jgi:phospholipase/lecithinase/hemolysin
MRQVLKAVLRLALVAACIAAPFQGALAAPPDRFVVFGDSLSDPGNAFVLLRRVTVPPFASFVPSAPYARGGLHFSNGATWVEQLSTLEQAMPSSGPALAQPAVFANFAVGGARARGAGPFDLAAQVGLFLARTGGAAPADALYVVWIGGDDLRDAVQALAVNASGASSAAIVQQAVVSIGHQLTLLYTAGARRFLVLNAPDLGLAPEARLLGPVVQGAATFLSSQFNAGLQQVLAGVAAGLPGTRLVTLDVFALLQEVVAAPSAVGLQNVTQPCIVLNTRSQPYCPNASEYLFWDSTHPTVAGHRIVAERAAAALAAAPPP